MLVLLCVIESNAEILANLTVESVKQNPTAHKSHVLHVQEATAMHSVPVENGSSVGSTLVSNPSNTNMHLVSKEEEEAYVHAEHEYVKQALHDKMYEKMALVSACSQRAPLLFPLKV